MLVLHIGAGVTAAIFKRAARTGEARADVKPMIATLPADVSRQQIFLTRIPPAEVEAT
jgi:hypothetical protein